MARRRPDDHEFAADSILDVVANIVGILIILIVSAAVRVGSAPLELQSLLQPPPEAKSEEQAARESPSAAPAEKSIETPETDDDVGRIAAAPASLQPLEPSADVAPVRPDSTSPRASVPLPAPPNEPSPETIAEYEAVRRRLALLEAEHAAAEQALAAAGRLDAAAQAQLARQESKLGEASGLLQGKRRTADEIRTEVETIAAQLAAARRHLEALEKTKPASKQIRHRVTPVSRTVQGQEIHFRLAEGRVSVIPMEEMKERLKSQIARQRDWLAKFRKHQGEIGPVQGYRMRYVVEREDSGVDDLRGGGGMMRIVVSHFECVPERSLAAESAATALRPDSAFQRALRSASADAALTFWVYPDSFALYGELTQFAHREGFTVAARPLPDGVPIAGSPKGTRSAGQ